MTLTRLDRVRRRLILGDGIATDADGVKLSYTVPAGKSAVLRSWSWVNNAGTPSWRLWIVRAGALIAVTVFSTGSARADSVSIPLEAGDEVRFQVSGPAAVNSTADCHFGIEESP